MLCLFMCRYTQHSKKAIFTIGSLLIFFLMISHDGIFNMQLDYTNYMNLFLGKNSMYGNLDVKDGYDLELPFFYFDEFLRLFPREPFTYILAIGITFCLPFFIIVWKESKNPPLSFFLLLVLNNTSIWLFFFSVHRQMFATTFFLWAFILFRYTNFKKKKYFIAILLILGLLSHSSSYFVVPLAIGVFFIKTPPKKYLYLGVFISLICGLFAKKIIGEQMIFMLGQLGDVEEISRSTSYMLEGTFDGMESHEFTALPPMALLICLFIHTYSKEDLERYCVKCWILAFILFLSLTSVPLINRAVLYFFLMGIAGGMPVAMNKLRIKQQYFAFMLFFLYIAFRAYSRPEYLLLPYNFIFS